MVSSLCLVDYYSIQPLVSWLLWHPVSGRLIAMISRLLEWLLWYPCSLLLVDCYACGWLPWYPISVYLTAISTLWLVDCYVSSQWLTAMVSNLFLPYCCIQSLVSWVLCIQPVADGRGIQSLSTYCCIQSLVGWLLCIHSVVDRHGIQSLSTLMLFPVSGWLTAIVSCLWLTAMVSNLCLPYCCIQSLVGWLPCIQSVVDGHGIQSLSTLLLYPVSGWLTVMSQSTSLLYPVSV